MSKLAKGDLHFPMNALNISKLIGKILRAYSDQETAATATTVMSNGIIDQDSSKPSVSFVSSKSAATGESLVIDVQYVRDGAAAVSLLTSTFTFDSTKVRGRLYELPVNVDRSLREGDVVQVVRTYVAGGAPTMANTRVVLEPRA